MPTLAALPPPPPGRTGWPWTEETPAPAEQGSGAAWPRLTIVTPSYMQAQYLEKTIRSVLLQGYPALEYFVMDGGSTDGSAEIIRKYEPWLAGWRCEKDCGQVDAILAGWERATGDVVAWINSDDWYVPGALLAVGRHFQEHPAEQWISGAVEDYTEDERFVKRHAAASATAAECLGRRAFSYQQPGMFWRRELVQRLGWLDRSLHYSFDYDLWIRCHAAGATLAPIDQTVAGFRRHAASKTMTRQHLFVREDWEVFRRYASALPLAEARQAEQWLRAYEADLLPNIVYAFLAQGRRAEAVRHLLRRASLLPALRPRKLALGLLWRVLISGQPAEWAAPSRTAAA